MKIYPYSAASASAKELSLALGIKRLRREGKALDLRGQTVINWGCSAIRRELHNINILNHPDAVAIAANKLKAFVAMDDPVDVPPFTTKREEAIQWLKEGCAVVVRETLTGHSGEGIIILDKPDAEVPVAPLYTKYIPKKLEYRIHVHKNNAFFVQRKARNKEVPDGKVNWQVRNHVNGFIFAHVDVEVAEEAKYAAIMAVKSIGLDFGAVDTIQGVKDKKWYVLEVNTACGLAGETVNKYVEQFKGYQ